MFQKRKRWVKREVGLLVNRGLHLRGQLVIRWWETYSTKQEQKYQQKHDASPKNDHVTLEIPNNCCHMTTHPKQVPVPPSPLVSSPSTRTSPSATSSPPLDFPELPPPPMLTRLMKKQLFSSNQSFYLRFAVKRDVRKCSHLESEEWTQLHATAANCGRRASAVLQAALKVASADKSCEQGGKAVTKNVWRIFSQRALDIFFMP